MAMMTGDRPVVISVIGTTTTSHQTNYTVKVPYSSMARTIQVITKQGGKITNVTIATMASSVVPSVVPSEVTIVVPSEVTIVVPSVAPMTKIKPIKESNKGFKPKKK